MTHPLRRAATLTAATLLVLSLAACGDDSAGDDSNGGGDADRAGGSQATVADTPLAAASTEDYCTAVSDGSAFDGVDPGDEEAFVAALKEFAGRIEAVGTPADIPDDAREGFEIQLEAIDDLDADEIDLDDPASFEDDFSEEDKEKVEAYNDYLNETCDADVATTPSTR